jgi:O-antigen/teichoic acid export membrane protein
VLAESGLGEALIQRREPTREDESTVFWFNLAAATGLALALCAAAPWISQFYGEPRLTGLTWAMALNVWLSAWLTVPLALLSKQLQFRIQAKASAFATVAGGAAGIALALQGAGAWALAAQAVAGTAANALVLWRLCPWRPALVFRRESFGSLFGFGSYLLASSLLDTFASRLYTIVIGKLHSAYELGLYTRAVSTRDIPQDFLAAIFSRVALPAFSSQAHDAVALRAGLRAGLRAAVAINFPAMFGLAVTAPLLVPVVFGSQWEGSVMPLQVLCLAGGLWPAHVANLNALMALGHSHLFFRLELVKKGIFVVLLLLASRSGIVAIAWAVAASSAVAFFINCRYSRRFLGYSWLDQLRDMAPAALLAFAMAGVVALAGVLLASLPDALRLAAEIGIGVAVYAGGARLLRLPVIVPRPSA